ncbi:hypothetical protein BL254_01000 [Protofrankia sp. BMG5.30]|nr:hypothetical protein BL254_01000 [Protofrankia sp. BMG5.30]
MDALADALARLHGHFEVDGHRLTGDQAGVRGEGSIIQSLLKGLDLAGANFGPLSCADLRFEEVDLSNSAWSKISMRRVGFSGYRLVSWSVRFERVEDVAFTNCRPDYCSWTAQRSSGVIFLRAAPFREAEFDRRLDRFVFRDCRLDGARFDATSAGQCDLREADIAGVNGLLTLRGARISLHQAGEAGIILADEVGISVE